MNPLLILGASTRAAAFSAIRAGFDPICGDMFADADLRAFAEILDVPDYPHRLLDATSGIPDQTPWIFTGALENSPAAVHQLSQRLTLWGNPADVLRRCRDPWQCHAALESQGFPAIELCTGTSPPPRDNSWLMKPLHSSAGRAITLWGPQTQPLPEPHYFQRFITGTSIAGAFLAGPSGTRLLGVSQQLIGVAELHAPKFGYCGSIFPCPLPAVRDSACQKQISQIGTTISREFGLCGLFGIDFIHDGSQVWMTEVNPRYTASMELIEYRRQVPLLGLQRTACEKMPDTSALEVAEGLETRYCVKVILYADRQARAPDLAPWIPEQVALSDLPRLADIPIRGTAIAPEQPVFTALGEGKNPVRVFQDLLTRTSKLWEKFLK